MNRQLNNMTMVTLGKHLPKARQTRQHQYNQSIARCQEFKESFEVVKHEPIAQAIEKSADIKSKGGKKGQRFEEIQAEIFTAYLEGIDLSSKSEQALIALANRLTLGKLKLLYTAKSKQYKTKKSKKSNGYFAEKCRIISYKDSETNQWIIPQRQPNYDFFIACRDACICGLLTDNDILANQSNGLDGGYNIKQGFSEIDAYIYKEFTHGGKEQQHIYVETDDGTEDVTALLSGYVTSRYDGICITENIDHAILFDTIRTELLSVPKIGNSLLRQFRYMADRELDETIARKLHIHRNTVTNRKKIIRSIIKNVLKD